MDGAVVSLHCGQCGHRFTRVSAGAGRNVHCPVCDGEIPLPRPEGAEDEPGLRVLRDITVDGRSVLCASCRATMDPGDRICADCGTERLTEDGEGGPAAPPPPTVRGRFSTRKAAGALLLLVAALAAGHWILRPSPAPDAPADQVPDTDTRLAEARQRLRRQLDTERPLADVGDDIVLEHRTGRVLRGRMLERNATGLDLRTDAGRERVLFEDLRSRSRLVTDPDYRERQIEERARRAASGP